MLTLLVLLIAILEPIACILHCTSWESVLGHAHGSAAHTQQAPSAQFNHVFAHTFNEQLAAFQKRLPQQFTTLTKLVQACIDVNGHFPLLAQPFHEFAVIPLLLGSILLILCQFLASYSPILIPQYAENLLRPPIN